MGADHDHASFVSTTDVADPLSITKKQKMSKSSEIKCTNENCELIARFMPPTEVVEIKGLKHLEVKYLCSEGHISTEHKLLK